MLARICWLNAGMVAPSFLAFFHRMRMVDMLRLDAKVCMTGLLCSDWLCDPEKMFPKRCCQLCKQRPSALPGCAFETKQAKTQNLWGKSMTWADWKPLGPMMWGKKHIYIRCRGFEVGLVWQRCFSLRQKITKKRGATMFFHDLVDHVNSFWFDFFLSTGIFGCFWPVWPLFSSKIKNEGFVLVSLSNTSWSRTTSKTQNHSWRERFLPFTNSFKTWSAFI